MKKHLAIVLALSFLISLIPTYVSRANYIANENTISSKYYTADANDAWNSYTLDNIKNKKIVGYAQDSNFWNQFSDDYFYQNMTQPQKDYYDRLMAACNALMYSDIPAETQVANVTDYVDGTFPSNRREIISVLPGVSHTGVSKADALEIFIIFSNANPQFYFLSGGMVFVSNGLTYAIIYQDYADPTDRNAATIKIERKLKDWIDTVNRGTTYLERERNIYELLASNLTYAKGSWEPHQSVATALLTGITVCAGYSECFAMLAKAAGIPCTVLTSDEHEWVQVKLGKYWYNADITIDDNGTYPDWSYFNMSDDTFNRDGFHNYDAMYKTLGRPNCPYDFGYEPGGNPEANATIGGVPQSVIVPVDQNQNDNSNTVLKEPMYRLLNNINGEHLFTSDDNERMTLVSYGWVYEGVAWNSPKSSPMYKPIYRVYNPISGEHHYTMDENEKNTLVSQYGWRDEGIKWYSNKKDGVPVYRLYNPQISGIGAHHYTTSLYERNTLVETSGWINEGICWYGI